MTFGRGFAITASVAFGGRDRRSVHLEKDERGRSGMDELWRYDATGLAELIRSKQVSSLEVTDAAISRIEMFNPILNAVIVDRFEQAREEARRNRSGSFAGVPLLLKDLGAAQEGEPFWLGSAVLRNADYRAPVTSYYVQALCDAGFIVIGRTNAPEFGTNITTEPVSTGATRNPWNLEYSSGGSSGGSAAAVASGMAPVGQASDGGGSIRFPASYCGLVGLKPSRGRVSKGPLAGDGWAGSTIDGALTRSIRDAAAVLDVMAGYRSGDPYTAPAFAQPLIEEVNQPVRRLRIGVLDHSLLRAAQTDPRVTEAVRAVADLLGQHGHMVEEAWPEALGEEEFQPRFVDVVKGSIAQQFRSLERMLGRSVDLDEIESDNRVFVELGRQLPAYRYVESVDWLQSYGRRVAKFFEIDGYDLLLTPVAPRLPPKLGYLSDPKLGLDRQLEFLGFTGQFNVSGQPTISLPLAMSPGEDPLPIGIQLVAAYGHEDLLIRIGSWLEQAMPWAGRWPTIALEGPPA
ncbi:amidase [Ferrimicrobium sp.]|uniref:amidase n=2 Tax=Ferrimicrobium sp. TaxID=2926050 RepID=UPI002610D92F|nr:amidase family protein [Ferrimicrobium sp.]